ncbi:MAG: sigma-70 family RNA polymerase sigma factor [Clostridia bacterium]|nr:sigma-70 family RNA polymerase sigma factor [Clostridia bacterium]
MVNKKYVNAKCFVFSENGYEEITYIELCRRWEHDKNYKDRKFIPLHGMLVEVTPKDYIDFYRNKRRQKYIDERSKENGDISYEALTADGLNGNDVIASGEEDIAEAVTRKIMIDKLSRCLPLLEKSEQKLIRALYFEEMSERQFSVFSGIPQKTINNRKKKILLKLKKLLES